MFSLKTMKQRQVNVIPRYDWNQDLSDSSISAESNTEEKAKHKSTLCLGCSIRYETVKNALNCVWHVIDVQKNSPAAKASIYSDGTDYIVGYDNRLFSEPNELTELLTYYQDSSESSSVYLSLFVYNWRMDSFRHVVVNMSETGHLGIDVGNGYLHIIPPPSIQQQASNILTSTNEMHNLPPIDYTSNLALNQVPSTHQQSPLSSSSSPDQQKSNNTIPIIDSINHQITSNANSVETSMQQESTEGSTTGCPSSSYYASAQESTATGNTSHVITEEPSAEYVVNLPSLSTTTVPAQQHESVLLYQPVVDERDNQPKQTLDINIVSYNPIGFTHDSNELSLGDIIGEEE